MTTTNGQSGEASTTADAQKVEALLAKVTPAEGYAGDITPEDCWHALQDIDSALLIDVRTKAEWAFVGTPDLSDLSRALGCVEWVSFPAMSPNADFVAETKAFAEANGAAASTPLFFLCRSGQRSIAAAIAMAQAGFSNTFNVLYGFEGGPNDNGHRGTLNGWKVVGLPWRQG